jgi:hypothetical protein
MRANNHSFISLNQVYYSQYIPQFDSLLKMIERDVRKLQDLGKMKEMMHGMKTGKLNSY